MTQDFGQRPNEQACAATKHRPTTELPDYGKPTSDWLCQCGEYRYEARPA